MYYIKISDFSEIFTYRHLIAVGTSEYTGAFSSKFPIASRTPSAAFLISSRDEFGLTRTSFAFSIASSKLATIKITATKSKK